MENTTRSGGIFIALPLLFCYNGSVRFAWGHSSVGRMPERQTHKMPPAQVLILSRRFVGVYVHNH